MSEQYRKFKISELFESQNVKHILKKCDLTQSGSYPCYSSDINGIIGYTNTPEFIVSEKKRYYIIFGDHTAALHISDVSFSVLDNVKVLMPKINDIETILYIFAEWKSQIPDTGYSRKWKYAQKCEILLPITKSGSIDINKIHNIIGNIKSKLISERIAYLQHIIELYERVGNE